MTRYDINRPIGLVSPCREVESNCQKAHMFKRCGLKPSHLILPLDPGSGRTTFLEYLSDMYKDHGVLSFNSGLDNFIEVRFDGTLPQLKQVFATIDSAAVYSNAFSNVVGMDISNLAAHLNETQFAEFMNNCKRVCESACVVFFVRSEPTRNEERLAEKLLESINHIKRLRIEPYTAEDICELIEKSICEHGIVIEHLQMFHDTLMDMVTDCGISGVKEALATAKELIQYADFTGFTPTVDDKSLTAMLNDRTVKMRGANLSEQK